MTESFWQIIIKLTLLLEIREMIVNMVPGGLWILLM